MRTTELEYAKKTEEDTYELTVAESVPECEIRVISFSAPAG